MFYCKASNLMYFDVYDVKFDIKSAKYALKLNFLHLIYLRGMGLTAYMLTPTSTIKL